MDQFLKTGAFTKELMMGQTMRDLSSTIKDANQLGDHEDEEGFGSPQEDGAVGDISGIEDGTHQHCSQIEDDMLEEEVSNI